VAGSGSGNGGGNNGSGYNGGSGNNGYNGGSGNNGSGYNNGRRNEWVAVAVAVWQWQWQLDSVALWHLESGSGSWIVAVEPCMLFICVPQWPIDTG
jgi:hypothetical protein